MNRECIMCKTLIKDDGRCYNTKCSSYSCRVDEDITQEECEYCGDTGRTMKMVCYGGSPIERWEDCTYCDWEDRDE